MNKEQFTGALRELLTLATTALLAYGIGTDVLWQAVTGGVVTLGLLVWSIRANEGPEAILTILRKLITAIGGVAVAFNYLQPDKSEALVPLITTFVSIVWSMFLKGKIAPADAVKVLVGALCLMSVGCILSADSQGNYSLRPDPYTIDKGLDYLTKRGSAKDSDVEYYDSETGEVIDPADYGLYDIDA